MVRLRAIVASIGIVASTIALAQPGPGRGPCANDIKTLCSSVQPGGGRIRACMREHRTQLSEACKLAIADRVLKGKRAKGAGGKKKL